MNKTILQTISLQDYVKRLWNHSNTKIPVTIGKGTDTAKPRSKAPYRGNNMCSRSVSGNGILHWGCHVCAGFFPGTYDLLIWCVRPGSEAFAHFDGLVQERRNTSAPAMELRLSYTNPLILWCCLRTKISVFSTKTINMSPLPQQLIKQTGVLTNPILRVDCIARSAVALVLTM